MRRIRIDQPSSPGYPHVYPYPNYFPSSSSSSSGRVSAFGTAPIDEDALDDASEEARVKAEAKRLEDKISEAAKKKSSFEEVSALQREVEQWLAKELARRPNREHASLRLSAALLGAILVNGFAYNEARKNAKGVEVSLMDKLEQAELVKRKLEFELHRQRTQYSQKVFELQQLKHEVHRLSGTSPMSSPPRGAAPALGSSLVTPPRAMSVQPSAVQRIGTPTARAQTPGYGGYSHFPKPRTASVAAETSHLPVGSLIPGPMPGASRSQGASPERQQHQRWIPPVTATRDDTDAERERMRGRARPASASGFAHGATLISRPRTSAAWRP